MAAKRETVTVVRKAQVDKIKPTAGPTQEFDVPGCLVLPRASNESGQGWVQVSGFTIWAPVGTDVRADDQIRVRGQLHSVEGDPGRFPVKRGFGVAITTERVGKAAS